MDRFAANTFRTLGLIVLAIVVIAISLGLALLGLCFAVLTSKDNSGIPYFYLGIGAALVVLIGGISAIGAMARVIFRESKYQDHNNEGLPPLPPYSIVPPVPAPPGAAIPPTFAPLPIPQPRRALDAATHLSPASRAAVDRLILAIAAQASAQLVIGIIEWMWAPHLDPHFAMQRVRLHGPLLLGWSLAAIAPYVILAVALRRRPGTTAFSFCLVIPAMRIFFGFFGQTASIIVFLRTFHSGMPLLSVIPWALDCLIFYLAWKAVRLTGIEPSPGRLALSAIDIFLYSSSLPVIFFVLTYLWH